MNINIYGSTGTIGKKTLNIIDKFFPNIKINLLCANSNDILLLKQIKKFNPKYVHIFDKNKLSKLKKSVSKKTKVLDFEELNNYLYANRSELSILAISGYKSLYFLDQIIYNTDNLGLVSKEAIVSAGHIFKKKKYFQKTNIFPLDSEHFSLFDFMKSRKENNIYKIIITASGGPFHKRKYHDLKNIKFEEAIKHPKWNMGYKNSIDSATLVNKCLELVEAHYLFDIPFQKLDVLIHPEALVHSIVYNNNFTVNMNLFKNDMAIPIINFLMLTRKKFLNLDYNLKNIDISDLNFNKVEYSNFPVFKLFNQINKNLPENLIKFNIGNEIAVNLFKNKIIRYTDIYKIIKKVTSLNLYYPLNNIKDVIHYHEELERKLQFLYNIRN